MVAAGHLNSSHGNGNAVQGASACNSAVFAFRNTDPLARFECKLDSGSFEPCTSPKTYKVRKGKHSFAVRATDAAGNTDPTPATRSWKVKKKKK